MSPATMAALVVICAINFALGFAAHALNVRGEKRHNARLDAMRRTGRLV